MNWFELKQFWKIIYNACREKANREDKQLPCLKLIALEAHHRLVLREGQKENLKGG